METHSIPMFYKCSVCGVTRFVSSRELKRLTLSKKNHAVGGDGKTYPKCVRCGSAMYEYKPEGKIMRNAPHVFR